MKREEAKTRKEGECEGGRKRRCSSLVVSRTIFSHVIFKEGIFFVQLPGEWDQVQLCPPRSNISAAFLLYTLMLFTLY